MKTVILQTGGKQYKVKTGDQIKIEKIKGDFNIGDKLFFENILLSFNTEDNKDFEIGNPFIKSKVEAEITNIAKNKTIDVVKYKAKSRYFKKNGHRQPYFQVKILSIN